MEPADNSLEESYQDSAYDSTLESNGAAVVSGANQRPVSSNTRTRASYWRNSHIAFRLATVGLVIVGLIGLSTAGVSLFRKDKPSTQNASQLSGNYAVSNLPTEGLNANQQLAVGQADHLAINGQLEVNSGLVIAPGSRPSTPVTGQVYFDKTTKQPYYYNGTQFIGLSPNAVPQSVTSLGGTAGIIGLGSGLQVSGGQLAVSSSLLQAVANAGTGGPHVTSLQGLTGNVTLSGGTGISISGTTITNNGVVGLTSSDSSIAITPNGNGSYDLVAVQGGPGSLAVLLGPLAAQQDTSNGPSQQINKTGTGNFLEFASSGINTFVVSQTGQITSGTITYSQVLGAPTQIVNNIDGVSGPIALGTGLSITGNTLSAQTGVVSITGTTNQITAVDSGGGNYTLSLPQDIAASSSPTFGGATLNGALSVSGAAALTSSLNVSGATTLSSSLSVGSGGQLQVTASGDLSTSGNGSFGGTLGVTGTTTLGGALNANGVSTFGGNVSITGSHTFTTGTGTVTLGSLGAGLVQSNGSGVLSSTTADRNSASLFTGTLSVGNGGTGANTLTANGVLYGNGSSAVQTAIGTGGQVLLANALGVPVFTTVTGDISLSNTGVATVGKIQNTSVSFTTLSAGDVLQYDGSSIVNGHVTNTNLQAGSFSNITGVGALTSGSIGSGFGTIVTGNNITTTATVQGATVIASGSLQGNNLSINSGVFAVDNTGAITAVSGITTTGGYTQTGSGANSFSGATGFGGNVSVTGTTTLTGGLTANGGVTDTGNFSQTGAGTFGTGTGAVQLNGATTITGTNNLTVAGGTTTLGGILNVTGQATFSSNAAIQGGSLTLGVAGSTTGLLNLANTSSTNLVTLQGLDPSGTGNATIQFPSIAGGATDQVCLVSLGNCAGSGSGVTASGGSAGYVPVFTAGTSLTNSIIFQNGTSLGINTATPGAFALNVQGGNVNFSDSATVGNGFTVTAGASNLGGALTVGGATTLSSTLDVTGVTTLNGNTSVTGSNTLTVGTGATTLGGALSVNGLSTLGGGATVTGATNINTTGSASTAIGNATGSFSVTSSGLNVSTGGALTGVTGITTNGAYTQSGVSANTFSGATTFTGAGTALTVNTNATITGTATIGTLSVGAGGITSSGTLTVSSASPSSIAGQLNVTSGDLVVGVAGSVAGSLSLANSTNSNLGVLKVAAPTGVGNATYTLPSIAGGTGDIICLATLNNCGGSPNTVTTSSNGTPNALARFTGAHTIADSAISDNGTSVTISELLNASTISTATIQSTGALAITPSGALTVGATSQSLALQGNGSTTLSATSGGFTTTVGFVTPTANNTINFPNASGTVCLQNSVSCGFATSGSGVTSIDGQTGTVLVDNATGSGGTITIDDASTTQKGIAQFNSTNFSSSLGVINTIQGISTTSSVQFGNLTLGSGGNLTLSNTGQIFSNNLTSTGSGDITIDAATHTVTFLTDSGTNSFIFPSSGGLGQTICTSGIICASGAGQALLLEPSSAQDATANRSAIFVNKASGSGNLLQLQAGGSDALVIDNSGNTTINNSVTIAALTVTGTVTTNVITPTSAFTAGATGQQFTLQGSGSSVITATDSGFTTTVGFSGTPTANVRYNFAQNVAAGTYTVCTTVGNCAGTGGGVTTPGGTTDTLAKFSSSGSIADSIITENSGVITVGGSLNVGTSGSAQLTLGVPSVADGTLVFANAANGNTVTLNLAAAPGANRTVSLPNASGTIAVSASGPIQLDALTGQISCPSCLTGGGGGGGGVTDITGTAGGSSAISGNLTLNNALTSGSTITLDNASTTQKGIAQFNSTNFSSSLGVINLIQDIATTSSPTFANLSLQGATGLTIGSTTNLGKLFFKDGTADGFTTGFSPSVLTANQTLTIPNASGTLAVSASGNLSLSAAGDVSISNAPTFTTSVTTPSLLSTGAMSISAGGLLTIGSATQPVTVQGNGSTQIKATDSGNTTTVSFVTPTANNSISFPNASGTVCLQTSASCGFASSSNVVNTLNGLNGTVSLANATVGGSTITINDASTGQKGIAQFNSTNFTVTTGVVNTIQDIASTSSPTFNGLTTNGTYTANGNISQTGAGAFTTGSGAVTLNGDVSISGIKTLTVGTGAVAFGGALGVSGLTTLSGGATVTGITSITGTTTINTTGTANTTIGNATGAVSLNGATSVTGSNTLTVGSGGVTFGSLGSGIVQSSAGGLLSSSAVDRNSATLLSGTLNAANGGTGQNSYTVGDLLYASGATTLSKLSDVASGSCLISGGVGVAPTWGACAAAGTLTGAGTTNTLAMFTSSGVIGDSILTQSGTALTATGTLTVTGQITSTVSTGTAPLVVASTTKVVNLNADLLDGLDSTAFQVAGSYELTTGTDFVRNQNASAQTVANYWISGSGRADTSLLTPMLDVGTAGALGLGTSTATSVSIAKAGVPTTVNGSLTVTQAATLSSTLGVTGLATFNGGATLAANQNLTLNSGTGVFSQTFIKGTNGSAQTLSATNSNASATASTVNGTSISLVGNANGNLNANTINALNFNSVAALANNTFNGLNFGTGYSSLLTYNGTSIISGTGVLQSDGLSGTYTNAVTLNNASNSFTGNGSALTSLNGTNISSGTVGVGVGGTGVNGSSAANGSLLIGNGGGYSLGTLGAGTGISITNGSGTISVAVDNTVCLTSGNCSASGTAGGDLTGTYPNPTIAKLQGKTLTVSGSPTTGGVLQYNGSAFVDGLIADGNLQAGSFGNITGVGALTSGSIGSGFGTINTTSNITTSTTVQGATVNATTAFTLGGTNINTGGTLNNVAYLDQANIFTGATNTFNNAVTVKGASGLTLGVASSTAGKLTFASAGSANLAVLQVVAPTGSGTGTYTLPAIAGGTGDTICLVTLNNCPGSGASSVGLIDAGTLNANGASIAANVLYLQSASATWPGLVTTGAQTFAGAKTFNGQVISAVTTGTAPLVVASTTKVTNLNADQLDGLDSTAFQAAGTYAPGTAASYIQNQNAGQQATSNFWISGTGRADTSLLTPLLDAATSATALNIGTTNANAINLNQNTTVASGKSFTVTSGTTNLTGATTGDALTVSNSTSTGNIAVFKDNSTAVLTVADGGGVLLQNSVNSTSALQVKDLSGNSVLKVDTTIGYIGIDQTNAQAPLHVGLSPGGTFADGFEDNTIPPFTTSGTLPWLTTSTTQNSGSYSARSGAIGSSSTSSMILNKTLTSAGNVSFAFSTSSENGFDKLTFYIDGVSQGVWSGATAWTPTNYAVGSGAHTFTWTFSRDSTGSGGSNTVWVDDVQVTNVVGNSTSALFDGQVGVGTTSPGAALQVNGTASGITQILQSNATTPGDLLQLQDSNGNVNASFNSTGNQLTLGRISSSGTVTQGKIILGDGTTDNFGITLQSATITSSSKTYTIPNSTASTDTFCLLTLANCSGTAYISAVGAVDGAGSPNANGLTVSSGTLYLNSASATQPGVINATTQTFGGAKTFNGITTLAATGSNALAVTGAPINTATSSLIQIGGAIASGNTTANGGTYIGLNAPNSGAGSAADFFNFQKNGSSVALLTNGGALTVAGLIQGSSFQTAGGSFAVNSSGAITAATGVTSSGSVTFSGLSTLGIVHNSAAGLLSTSLIVNADLTSGAYGNITGVGTLTSLTVSGQITSTLANGTAPLVVASSTKVANLNADWLDGLDSTAFQAAGAYAPGTAASYIQNQNAGAQSTSNFWISGSGRADTSLLTSLLDTAGAGTLSVGTTNATSIALNKNVTVAASQTLRLIGDTTANRPTSPSAGTLFYDTTLNQLLVYNGTKWQADRSTATKIVSDGSTSQNPESADFMVPAASTAADTTINSAIAALPSGGGTVYLREGTYTVNDTISLPSNVTLVGSGTNTVIIYKNSAIAIAMITNSDTTSGNTNIRISNLKLAGNKTNNASPTHDGILMTNVGSGTGASAIPGLTLDNVYITDFYGPGIELDQVYNSSITNVQSTANQDSGLVMSIGSNDRIANSVFNGSTFSYGVTANNVTYSTFTGNVMQSNGSDGIYLNGNSDNTTISGNSVSLNTGWGIDVYDSSEVVVTGNEVKSNGLDGIVVDHSTGVTVEGNTVASNSFVGIMIFTANNVISGNTIQLNAHQGIKVNGNGNLISDNRLTSNAGALAESSIFINAGDNNKISDNLITDTAGTGYAIELASGSVSDSLSNNVFSGTGATSISDAGTGTVYSNQSRDVDGGQLVVRTADNASAFQIQNNAGSAFLTADTSAASKIQIGSSTTDATAVLLGLDSYNNGTDPTGFNGAEYYNSNLNKFRCYENGAWANCIGSAAGGVTSLNTFTGALSILGTANQIIVTNSTPNITLSLPQDIATTSTVTFGSVKTATLDTTSAVTLNIGATSSGITLNKNVTVAAGQSLRLIGDTTANRPASPSAGTLFYDTTTNQLIQWNGTKWVSDRSTATKIVAMGTATGCSGSSPVASANTDAADYVTTSCSSAQTVINSALTALPSGGGTVYLMEGTYIIDGSINIPNNTTLAGAGASTVVKFKDSVGAGTFYAITNTDTTTGTNVAIRDIQVDGNKSNNATGSPTMYGIQLNGMGSGSGATAREGAKISNVVVHDLTSRGINMTASANTTLSSNTSRANGSTGIYLGSSSNNTVEGNVSEGNSTSGILLDSSATNNAITGNSVNGNLFYGVWINSSSNNVISSNKIHDNGNTTTNNGIYLTSADSNSITGNDVTDSSCTTNCYAINIVSGNTNYLADNRFSVTSGTPTINDAGTGTVYANQMDGSGNLINRSQGGGLSVGKASAAATLDVQGGIKNSQLSSPSAPTLSIFGAAGATSRTYAVSALDGTGETLISSTATFATTANTLDGTHYVIISWPQVSGAVQYKVYRTVSPSNPSTTGLIGTVNGNVLTFNDTGIAASGSTPAANTTGGANIAGLIQGGSLSVTGNTTIGGTLGVTGVASFGTASSATGQLKLYSAGNTGSITIQGLSTTTNAVLSFPGTVGSLDTFCLQTANNCSTANFISAVGAVDGAGSPNANGLTVSSGTLYLNSASGTQPGVVNATTQTFGGNKTFTGLTVLQPSASLTNGQVGLTQTATFANATASGTVKGFVQNLTVSSSTAATNIGQEIDVADNSTTTTHTNTGLKVIMSGTNTFQSQIGVDATVSKGIGGQFNSTGASSTSLNCGPVSGQISLGLCVGSTTASGGIGLLANANSTSATLGIVGGGAAAIGYNTAISPSAGTYIYGLQGLATGSGAAAAYTSIGVYGEARTNGGTAYGGYFTTSAFTTQESGAALYATNTALVSQATNGLNGVNVLQAAGGAGGATSGTSGQAAGSGSGISLVTGAGGAATGASGTNTGGAGGTFAIQGGNGGNATSGIGGAGAGITLTAGNGGNGTGANANGNGGNITLSAGSAGTGGTGGSAGSVIVKNAANSTVALQVQTAASVPVLTVDTTNSQTILRGVSSDSVQSSELLNQFPPNNNFNNATYWTTCNASGWTGTATTATHAAAGGITACVATSSNLTVVSGATYQISFQLAGNSSSANTVTPSIGGISGQPIGQTGTNTQTVLITTSGTGALTFSPTTGFDGTISLVSVKLVTFAKSALTVQDSTGTGVLEVRTSTQSGNTFIGLQSGESNTTGFSNTANGALSLQNNTTGFKNTANGYSSLQNNTTGSNNTASGYVSQQFNTTGANNTSNGAFSLQFNTTGSNNTAIGSSSLQHNTFGFENTATGTNSLQSNTWGTDNTASGYRSLNSNTTGSNNTANGDASLQGNTTGNDNTANGLSSLASNTFGSFNTANGSNALKANVTGDNNTAIGYTAGYFDGNFYTLNNLSNSTAIGNKAQVQQSNSLILGGQDANAVKVGIGTTMPDNTLSVSPVATSAGTAGTGGVSSTTVTGVSTAFTAAMIGAKIIFANGSASTTPVTATITAVNVGGQTLTVTPAITVAAGTAFRIHYQGLQVTSAGKVGIGTAAPTADLQVNSTSATAFQIQDASGNSYLNLDNSSSTAAVLSLGKASTVTGGLKLYTSTNSGSITIQGILASGNYTVKFPATMAGDDTFCLVILANCSGGSGFITAVGAVDAAGSPNANGLTVTSGTLNLNSASGTQPGVVNATTQSFGGNKTFTGLTVLQPSASLTNGQVGLTQTATFANATGSGTVKGFVQNLTVSSSTAATNIGTEIDVTDNSTTTTHVNTGLTVVMSGSNTNQDQTGIKVTVAKGLGGNFTSTGAAGNSLSCGPISGSVSLGLCAGSTASNGTGLIATSSGNTSTINSGLGAGIVGYNNATSPSAGRYVTGVEGIASPQGSSAAYTSIGVYGEATAVGATAYGGYFTTTAFSLQNSGAALYATNTAPNSQAGAGLNGIYVLQAAGGAGGATSGTTGQTAGTGSGVNIATGAGGAAIGVSGTNTGGAGGTFAIQGGNGGNATSGIGGAGAAITLTAGNGGNSTGANANGNGGSITLSAGSAGTGGTGGSAGSVIVKNAVNSTVALQVQTATSTPVLTVDTSNSQTIVRGKLSSASLGSELVTSQDFTSANWSTCNGGAGGWSGTSTTATHNTANTVACSATSSNFVVTAGATYQITFTVAGNTTATNTVTPSIGVIAGPALGANTTHTVVITGSNTTALTFTPTLSFDGTISNISVKLVTFANSALTVQNSSGTGSLEVRADQSIGTTFIGLSAGQADWSGSHDVGIGDFSLQSNTTGGNNTATGWGSLQSNSSGTQNTANGTQSLQSNTNGSNNTASGYASLTSNTTGSNNIATGSFSLQNNTTGSNNTALGYQSLKANTTGTQNTATGDQSLLVNTTGTGNTAIGDSSLISNTTGALNTAIGDQTLSSNTTGSNNTVLGFNAGSSSSNFYTLNNLQNATAIGSNSQVQQSNTLILGGQGTNAVNVGIGTTMPDNTLSVSPVQYSAGTAGTGGISSATVTGSGTVWTSAMVGAKIIFANGSASTTPVTATITAVGSNTSMTVTPAVTVATGTSYRIQYQGFQVTSTGKVGIGTSTPTADLQINSQSATAFQVQNTSGNEIITADSSASQVLLGKASTLSGKLAIASSASAGIVTLTVGTTGTSYSLALPTTGVAGSQCLQSTSGSTTTVTALQWGSCGGGGGGQTRTINLVPEYPGAVVSGNGGSATSGTLTTDFDSTSSPYHNYYSWLSSLSSTNTYDVVLRTALPSDYASGFGSFTIYGYGGSTSTTNNDIQVTIKDSSNTVCASSVSALPTSTANTWAQKSVTVSGCSFSANSMITIIIHMSSKSSNEVRVGEISYQYTN